MTKLKTIDLTTCLRYSDEKITYLSPLISKAKYLKLVQDNYTRGYISQNWVKVRLSESRNEDHLKMIHNNPNKFIIIDNSNCQNKIIKLIDIK